MIKVWSHVGIQSTDMPNLENNESEYKIYLICYYLPKIYLILGYNLKA